MGEEQQDSAHDVCEPRSHTKEVSLHSYHSQKSRTKAAKKSSFESTPCKASRSSTRSKADKNVRPNFACAGTFFANAWKERSGSCDTLGAKPRITQASRVSAC